MNNIFLYLFIYLTLLKTLTNTITPFIFSIDLLLQSIAALLENTVGLPQRPALPALLESTSRPRPQALSPLRAPPVLPESTAGPPQRSALPALVESTVDHLGRLQRCHARGKD